MKYSTVLRKNHDLLSHICFLCAFSDFLILPGFIDFTSDEVVSIITLYDISQAIYMLFHGPQHVVFSCIVAADIVFTLREAITGIKCVRVVVFVSCNAS